jgi:hypothetical protein
MPASIVEGESKSSSFKVHRHSILFKNACMVVTGGNISGKASNS